MSKFLSQIAQVLRNSADHTSAMSEISACLEQNLGGNVFFALDPHGGAGQVPRVVEHAERFFNETVGLPYRSLYTVSVRANGREFGRLIAFFAWSCSREGMAARLADLAGKQIGKILERTRFNIRSAA